MTGLYVGSTAPFSGKNLFIAALGLHYKRKGLSVGYMKPVGASPAKDAATNALLDQDAAFIQQVLGLEQDPGQVTPVVVTQEFLAKAFASGCGDMMAQVGESFRTLSQNKDLMLVGGSGDLLNSGKYCGLEGTSVARVLGVKTLVVDRYGANGINYDAILAAKEQLGDSLAGCAFTDVPPEHLDEVRGFIQPFMERRGVPVLGMIPRDPFVGGIAIEDLAAGLDATVICSPQATDTIVEDVLIGTMQVENFMIHFQRRTHSAVVVGGDRSDIQLVALEGGCPCLILTGNLYPNGMILSRSETLERPIVVAKQDTYTAVRRIGHVWQQQKFRDQAKIAKGAELVASALDFPALERQLEM